jgi:opacity protein-like surface antigen
MRSFLLLSAGVLALLATPAAARNGAWYVGGDFGGMIVEDTDLDFSPAAGVKLDHDYGYDGGLFVGYDLGAFRIEAEAAYKKADLDSFTTSFPIPFPAGPAGPGAFDAGGGSTSALSFMINGMLDFGDDDGISGFVGGGVGMARVKANNQRVFANAAPYLDDSDSKLAWQIFAGVRQAISDNIDVTVKYRFFNVEGLRFEDIGGFRSEHTHFRSHSLLGGLTFNFGAPEPVPPPPPAEVETRVQPPPLPPAEVFTPPPPPPPQESDVKGENG